MQTRRVSALGSGIGRQLVRRGAHGAAAGDLQRAAGAAGHSGIGVDPMSALQVVCSSRPALPARGLAARGSALRRPAPA